MSRYMRKMKPNVSEACMELFGAEGIFHIRNGILSMPDFEIRRDARFLKRSIRKRPWKMSCSSC